MAIQVWALATLGRLTVFVERNKVAFDRLFKEFLTCCVLCKARGREQNREAQDRAEGDHEGPLRSAGLRTGPCSSKPSYGSFRSTNTVKRPGVAECPHLYCHRACVPYLDFAGVRVCVALGLVGLVLGLGSRSARGPHIRDTVITRGPKVTNVNFSVRVGTVVPRTVHLVEVPTVLVEVYPQYRGRKYFVYQDEIIIVDDDMRIVAVLTV